MRKIYVAFLSALLICQFSGICQLFTLVRDINDGDHSFAPTPRNLIEKGGLLYFKISDGNVSYSKNDGPAEGFWKSNGFAEGTVKIKGVTETETIDELVKVQSSFFFTIFNFGSATTELWKSDGTEAGTTVVKSWPVATLYYKEYRLHLLTGVQEVLYFVIRNSGDRDELWKSDGTTSGTTLVKVFDQISNLTDFGSILLFGATEDKTLKPYTQLWKTDGTATGTSLVKDVGFNISSYSENFVNAGSTLFFATSDIVNGYEVWKTDGTDAGTTIVKDIEPGNNGSNPNHFAVANGYFYFFTTTSDKGNALWKSDGTAAGTIEVKDLTDNPYGENNQILSFNGIIYFTGYDDATGSELWKSDGTAAGTALFKDLASGTQGSRPSSFSDVGGEFYFVDGSSQIWKSDGTEAGTFSLGVYQVSSVRTEAEFVKASGMVFFSGYDESNGNELRKTDGTPGGTVLVKNIVPTPGSSPQKFVAANGVVYFSALNYVNSPGPFVGPDVFHTDGTFSGTAKAERINGRYHSYPLDWINHNGVLFISGTASHNNNLDGYELYKITSIGERQIKVKDISPLFDQRGSRPNNFESVGKFLYFSATDGTAGFELWKSDGTEEGTVLVKNINPTASSNPDNTVNVNGTLFFTADDGANGIELWKSDGTEAGTIMIKNINASGRSNPSFLTNVNGVLYFAADDGVNGVELWKSNGTEAGTVIVKNINAGSNSSNPAFLTNVNGTLYFAADNGINGVEVWKSNGTSAGTVLVKDIYRGANSSNPSLFTNLHGNVLFAADDGISGRELWGSNGATSGTILVKDIQPGAIGSNPTALTKIGSNVLFAANDGVHGNEVWFSNGAELDTRLISEIEPGAAGSDPTEFFEYGSKVLAAATNAMVGSEVWIADAPADIPVLLAKIIAAGPLTICNNGNKVLLKANTGVGYSYQWKKDGINIAGATLSNYSAATAGVYSFIVTDALGNSAVSDAATIKMSSNPLATITAAGPTTLCAGKTVMLKATTGTGYTYQWKKAGVNIDNATSSVFTVNATGVYSVVVTNASGCSTISSGTSVVVNSLPLAAVTAGSPLTFCSGKSVMLKAATRAGYSYQWKKGSVNITGAILSSYTATTSGSYSVVVTNTSGCSSTSAVTTVVVNSLPPATIKATGPLTVCSGKTVLLKTNIGSGYTYQWKKGNVNIPGANSSSYTAAATGSYYVVVTNVAGCSATSAATTVVVNPSPVATISPAGSLSFCAGKSVLLKASIGAGYSYQWKKGNINIAGAKQSSYTAITSGSYSVVVTNIWGCSVTSEVKTVVANPIPLAAITAGGSLTFCSGKSVLLKANTGAGYSYQWKKGNINIAGANQSSYTAIASGSYSVVVTNIWGCSVTSAVKTVVVNPIPLAAITAGGSLTFCSGKSVLLKANTGAGYSYQWKKGNVNITGAVQSTYTAAIAGVYTVVVTNASGCSTTSTGINVTVNPVPIAIISANGPLSFSQGGSVVLKAPTGSGYAYQWKKDGVNITGAIASNYTATASGSYTVVVTNTGGCQAISQPAIVSVTPSRPITKTVTDEEDRIRVYPNPLYRNDYLNIEQDIKSAESGLLVIISDIAGRRIHSQVLTSNDKVIRIKGASGMYIVEFRWGTNKRKVFKIIKIE